VNTALVCGLFHAVVDAATVTAIFRATRIHEVSLKAAFCLVLGYDLIAFGSQVLLGWLCDRWASPKSAMLLGVGLALACLGAYSVEATTTTVLAGTGNALFHLGAGALVLRHGLDRALFSGLFVAPGALGLGFGLYYGKDPGLGPVWPLAFLLVVVLLGVVALPTRPLVPASSSPRVQSRSQLARWALTLLLVSIAIRSLVGLSAARGYPKSSWLLVGIPVAAFLGKSLGGLLADRWGWVETSVGALLLSAPLLAFSAPNPVLLWIGLLAFQMTMPVTLTATARLMPERLATAFGWTCLALVVGGVPTMFPWGDPACSKPMLLVWILLAALALFYGLRWVGIRRSAWATELSENGVNP
jgi:FSR family fosmidomycin resistance protein-like MFS transporter